MTQMVSARVYLVSKDFRNLVTPVLCGVVEDVHSISSTYCTLCITIVVRMFDVMWLSFGCVTEH
jgi:hypothetical protein